MFGIFWTITFFKVPSGRFKKREKERDEEGRGGEMGASSYKRAQVAWSYRVERGGGGSESLTRERIVRTAGKWVPTSGLAPLVPLVGSSSFAENSIIMIAYDVNDAPRQQLFPPERARGAAGPGHYRPEELDKATGHQGVYYWGMAANRII